MIIDETDRIVLRELESAEAGKAAELLSLFNENGGKPFTKDMVEAYIKLAYGFYGYGYYGVFMKDSGEMVGLAGFREGSCPLEIGYCIREDKRNLGLATEAVRLLMAYATLYFDWILEEEPAGETVTGEVLLTYRKNGKILVYGKTTENNPASLKVLLNNGFERDKEFVR